MTQAHLADKKLLQLTEQAASHMRTLIEQSDNRVKGLHIAVKNTGCAGMAYDVAYAETLPSNAVCVEDRGITLFVDNFASVFLAGCIVDYKKDLLSAGFVFKNPNVTGECGCGESFTVG